MIIGCGSKPIVDKGPEVPENVLAMLSLRNPKDFFADFSTVLHRTDPTGNVSKSLSGLLGPYGYPEFATFDPVRRMGVFVLTPAALGDESEWFIMARVTADAPIIEEMREMGATVRTLDHWTVATQTPAIFDRIESIDSYAQLLDIVPVEDISLRFFPRVIEQFEDEIRQQMAQQFQTGEADSTQWTLYADWLLEELRSLQSVGLGLDLSEEALKMSYVLEGQAGSVLAKMIQDLPQQNSLAKGAAIQAGAVANFVTRANSKALRTFIEGFYNRLVDSAPPADAEKIALFWQGLSPLLDSFGPAGFIAFDSLSEPMRYRQISEGTIERDSFLTAYESFYTDTWQGAMNAFAASFGQMAMPMMEVQLDAEADTFEGVTLSRLHFSIDTSTLDEAAAAEAAAISSDLGHYFAIHQGNFLAATDLDELKQVLAAINKGESLDDNLRERFIFANNDLLHGNIDLASVILQAMTQLERNGMPAEPWMLQLFADTELELLYRGYVSDRSLVIENEISVATIITTVTRGLTLFMLQALSGAR